MKENDIELIKGWFKHIEQLATDCKTANGFRMSAFDTLDEIKALAANSRQYIELHVPLNPWISVEERLPDFGKMVFVNNGGTIVKSRRYKCKVRGVKTNWQWVDSWAWTGKCNKVTHWMEQPELPK